MTYHLISRFVERRWFITEPREREWYLQLHARALRRSDWRLLAYAIMSNHLHLAAVAGVQPLASWLRPVHSPFAEMLNQVHQRIGPIFVRGPKAYPVVGERVGHLLAYIHNNPVRAGVCGAAADSTWTSHRAYVAKTDVPPWLHVSLGLRLTGVSSADEFDRWVNDPVRCADRSFSEEAHELERKLVAEQEAQDALAAGITNDAQHAIAGAIVEALANALGVPPTVIRGGSRGRLEVSARAAAVQCSLMLGLTQQGIASALNISQQRVSVLRRMTPPDEVRNLASRVLDNVLARNDARLAA